MFDRLGQDKARWRQSKMEAWRANLIASTRLVADAKSSKALTNPEIKGAYDKYLTLESKAGSPQCLGKLNLLSWTRRKYEPTECEKMVRFENKRALIMLQQVADSQFRKTKRSISNNSIFQEQPESYLSQYNRMRQALEASKNNDSEEQVLESKNGSPRWSRKELNNEHRQSTERHILYQKYLQEFPNLLKHIESRLDCREQEQDEFKSLKRKKIETFLNATLEVAHPSEYSALRAKEKKKQNIDIHALYDAQLQRLNKKWSGRRIGKLVESLDDPLRRRTEGKGIKERGKSKTVSIEGVMTLPSETAQLPGADSTKGNVLRGQLGTDTLRTISSYI